MGHANYSNLSNLWVNLLYAKGTLTIGQAVAVAGRRGEQLQASDGGYDADSGMVGMALTEYVFFLGGDRKWWAGGGDWEGPYIKPMLMLDCYKPKVYRIGPDLRALFRACDANPDDLTVHGATADYIADQGFDQWASFVRDLPRVRAAYRRQVDAEDNADDDWELTDRVPWRFCEGWRTRYREVPKMSHVTH